MDAGSISIALTSLKSAGEILKSLNSLRTDSKVRNLVIELQNQILEAQRSALLAQEEQNQIRRELAEVRSWETEAARFRLTEISSGVFVYAVRPEAKGDEPDHWLCPICFSHKKKAILQWSNTDGLNKKTFHCQGCNNDVEDASQQKRPPK
jgi:hypothetical protein